MLDNLRSELLPSMEEDLLITAPADGNDIAAATESYFETLMDAEKNLDVIELTQTGASVIEEALATTNESDDMETIVAEVNAVSMVLVGQPLAISAIEADNKNGDKKSVLEKIKEFLTKILNFIKEKGKQLWNKILVLIAKVKNIVVANVQQKLFAKKLDKYIEKCTKSYSGWFAGDTAKKLAEDLYPVSDKGVVDLDTVKAAFELRATTSDLVTEIENEIANVNDITKDYKILDKLKNKI